MENKPLSISLIGATGRMGKRIIKLSMNNPEFKLVGGCAGQFSNHVGIDLGSIIKEEPMGVILDSNKENALEKADVVIDFSDHHATVENLEAAIKQGKPIVIGTTGHHVDNERAIEAASKYIPILFASNFSLGMNLCIQAVQNFAQALKGQCFIDIIEAHHVQKKDLPSGSAIALANATNFPQICMSVSLQEPRNKDAVIIHSIRAGNNVGEHTIVFTCAEEKIELKYQAFSRDVYAKGALKAARFLADKPPGLYYFKDAFFN
ncbi:MAG TPA: 4-hydroxy-tetrahydrodipicolinate reductase [Rhabdochlamydiaceae bacterium]|nr:4-hydroxy-tetrahydrodipicolinate reductase [Rhabdochlamydiaceae bacterium]